MRLKKEYLFLLLAIAALSVYLFSRSGDQTHFELPQLAEVGTDKIDRLIISKGERVVELQKKDTQWVVGPKAYPGDSIKIKNMLRSAADLTITALVSESGNLTRYGLTEDQKVKVQAFTGKDMVREFAIGSRAPTQQHTFVALTADEKKVYHARGNIDVTYNHTIDELRDKTVLSYEKSDVSALILTRGDLSATFTRKETAPQEPPPSDGSQEPQAPQPKIQWVDADGNPADTSQIDSLIGRFSKLKCDDYLEDDAKKGLEDPLWKVTLKTEQADHHLLLFEKGDAEGIEFPAVSSDSPYAFILHKSRVETYEKEITNLLTLETPDAKATQTQ